MFKKFLKKLYLSAVKLNHTNILNLLEQDTDAKFLDLGCDDGVLTTKFANKIKTKNVYGVEIVDERISLAEKNGVKVKKFDLNGEFNYKDKEFDVIHANQVIEHIVNSDKFLSESYRILKPGGYMIVSTENASSWCNIFASILGWQIFSLTNFSDKKPSIGNPFSLSIDENNRISSWNHVRIYNIRGLIDYSKQFGFKLETVKGAGYFPFPSFLGLYDVTHSHFITLKLRKI